MIFLSASLHSYKALLVEGIGACFAVAEQSQLRLVHSIEPEHFKHAPLRVNDLKKDGSPHYRHALRLQFSAEFEENAVEVTLAARRIHKPGERRVRANRPALLPDLLAAIPVVVALGGYIRRQAGRRSLYR